MSFCLSCSKNRWFWFIWWFSHLPGPSISPKRTPMVATLSRLCRGRTRVLGPSARKTHATRPKATCCRASKASFGRKTVVWAVLVCVLTLEDPPPKKEKPGIFVVVSKKRRTEKQVIFLCQNRRTVKHVFFLQCQCRRFRLF